MCVKSLQTTRAKGELTGFSKSYSLTLLSYLLRDKMETGNLMKIKKKEAEIWFFIAILYQNNCLVVTAP